MRKIWMIVALVCVASCGGGSGSSGGSATPTTPTQTNRAPVIASATVSPTFGIADLQAFTFAVIASDPDGDPLTYAWNAAGLTTTGATPPAVVFQSPGGNGVATVTVTDSKGATATSTMNFTVGSMTGQWSITSGPLINSALNLNQSASGIITGAFSNPSLGNGQIDPAQPGSINAAGAVQFRFKVGRFTDANISGTMDTTGTRVTGAVSGSGFTGQPVVMQKQ
jgi:hypothetical protein